MKGLLIGEVQRLLARRMLRWLALLAVASIAVAGVLTFLNTEAVDDAEMEARRRAVQAQVEACIESRQDVPAPPGEDGRPPTLEDRCSFGAGPSLQDPRFRLRQLTGVFQGTTAPLVVVGWLIGASSIGADWQARTVTTLLTWETRRRRVLVAKVVAAVLVACAFTLAAQAVLAGALAPSAALHGTTAGTGGTWLRTLAGVLARGTALVAVATAIGFAVASIGRNTAAALGIGFAYFVVLENAVGGFLADFRRWLLLGNAIVWVSGENGGGDVGGRSVVAAGLFLASVAVGLVLAAAVLFQRRDVA